MRWAFSFVVIAAAACSKSAEPPSAAWQCHTVAIDHGTQSVCDGASFGASGSGYTCIPDASGPGVVPRDVGTSDGQGGTSDGNGNGGNAGHTGDGAGSGGATSGGGGTQDGTGAGGATSSGGTQDGTSSGGAGGNASSICPPGTHPGPGGTTGDGAGPSGGGGAGTSGGGGTSDGAGTSGSGGSTGDGGGYTCTPSGDGTQCTSTTCDKGYHASTCGTCVPDGCSTCNCGGGSSGSSGSSGSVGGPGCTLTQGYWKNHPEAWPLTSLTLGGTTYTQAQLLSIFGMSPGGDASLILAHQLIAALLNGAAGAGQAPIASVVGQAQAWLSANGKTLPYGTSSSSPEGAQAVALANQLDAYNNGMSGIPHCN
jgi:hypothetical protein